MKVLFLACCLAIAFAAASAISMVEKFAWKDLDFSWPSDNVKEAAIQEGSYVRGNNLPLAFDVWRDKIFLTVPRWKHGVASTLNFIEISNEKSPVFHPYPSWEWNQLQAYTEENPTIVSSFGIRVDECDRLWVVDSGMTDLLGRPTKMQSPSVLVFDLNTNKLLKRFEIPVNQIKADSFFVNIFVDVVPERCEETFAYILDIYAYAIIVYDFEQDRSWRVNHNYFAFDPVQGDLHVKGVNFQWHDGIFGMALGKLLNENGDRTLYFHALASTNEFSVSNMVLKNESFSTNRESFHAFTRLGSRGFNTQSSSEVFHSSTEVVFYTLLNKDAVGCWNTKRPFTVENQGVVANDSELLVFPNDLRIDSRGNLLVLSNRMPVFMFSTLPSETNYRILSGKASELIKGTPCEM